MEIVERPSKNGSYYTVYIRKLSDGLHAFTLSKPLEGLCNSQERKVGKK